jgi:ribonuclease P protein component
LRALRSKTEAIDINNQYLTPTRIGISISTKVSKRASVRNRIKRRIRAAFRCLLPHLLPGWRLVIVVQPSAVQEECDYQQFLQELKQLLAEAEVLNGYS